MKKDSIYQRAKKNGCNFVATCVSISQWQWNEYMKGARPANQKKVVRAAVLAGILTPEEGRNEIKKPYFNPYNHYVTPKYIVYVNSGIEHFIQVH